MNEQIPDAEIIRDLNNDLRGLNNQGEKSNDQKTEVVPPADFLPRELVRLFVLGKNGLIVTYVGKNVSENALVIVKGAYAPSDREIDLYRNSIQDHIRKTNPALVEWFQRNTNTALAELAVFETLRFVSLAEVLRQGSIQKQKENEKKEKPDG